MTSASGRALFPCVWKRPLTKRSVLGSSVDVHWGVGRPADDDQRSQPSEVPEG